MRVNFYLKPLPGIELTDGIAKIIVLIRSYHLIPRPGIKLVSVEKHQPETYFRAPHQLIYSSWADTTHSCHNDRSFTLTSRHSNLLQRRSPDLRGGSPRAARAKLRRHSSSYGPDLPLALQQQHRWDRSRQLRVQQDQVRPDFTQYCIIMIFTTALTHYLNFQMPARIIVLSRFPTTT